MYKTCAKLDNSCANMVRIEHFPKIRGGGDYYLGGDLTNCW
jgi:hypothetical protein